MRSNPYEYRKEVKFPLEIFICMKLYILLHHFIDSNVSLLLFLCLVALSFALLSQSLCNWYKSICTLLIQKSLIMCLNIYVNQIRIEMRNHATAFRKFEWMLMERFADLMPLSRKSLDKRSLSFSLSPTRFATVLRFRSLTKQHPMLGKFECWAKKFRIESMFRVEWHVLLIFCLFLFSSFLLLISFPFWMRSSQYLCVQIISLCVWMCVCVCLSMICFSFICCEIIYSITSATNIKMHLCRTQHHS